jgi:hypothetical protein
MELFAARRAIPKPPRFIDENGGGASAATKSGTRKKLRLEARTRPLGIAF